MHGLVLLNQKEILDIKPCFQKIFKERKSKKIWCDKESAFFLKRNVKIL